MSRTTEFVDRWFDVEQPAAYDDERIIGERLPPDSEVAHGELDPKTLSMRTPACLCCLVTVWV